MRKIAHVEQLEIESQNRAVGNAQNKNDNQLGKQ